MFNPAEAVDGGLSLVAIEDKIRTVIIPVRTRLLERLQMKAALHQQEQEQYLMQQAQRSKSARAVSPTQFDNRSGSYYDSNTYHGGNHQSYMYPPSMIPGDHSFAGHGNGKHRNGYSHGYKNEFEVGTGAKGSIKQSSGKQKVAFPPTLPHARVDPSLMKRRAAKLVGTKQSDTAHTIPPSLISSSSSQSYHNHHNIQLSTTLKDDSISNGGNGEEISYATVGDSNSNAESNTSHVRVDDEDEPMSSRRRRRLNQIVPNPRKPRMAYYLCSSCNETYQSLASENPWWAVYCHECPKCHKKQIPRIDINLVSNAIESDPNVLALYGEGVDDSGDELDDCGMGSGGEDDDCLDTTKGAVDSTAKDAHPFDGEGLLPQEEASKLLVLMCHARTCTGTHQSQKHADICKSTKFLMLHIRDCTGIDIHGQSCQFPWCMPCKRMLRHLTHCYEPSSCPVCNPFGLPDAYQQLKILNNQRILQEQDENGRVEGDQDFKAEKITMNDTPSLDLSGKEGEMGGKCEEGSATEFHPDGGINESSSSSSSNNFNNSNVDSLNNCSNQTQ